MDSIIAHNTRPNSNILARGEKPKSSCTWKAGSAPAATPDPSVQGVDVGISVKVRRTFDLDTVQQQFGAMLHILMKWETDDVDADADDGVTTWEPEWQPRWVIKVRQETLPCTSTDLRSSLPWWLTSMSRCRRM